MEYKLFSTAPRHPRFASQVTSCKVHILSTLLTNAAFLLQMTWRISKTLTDSLRQRLLQTWGCELPLKSDASKFLRCCVVNCYFLEWCNDCIEHSFSPWTGTLLLYTSYGRRLLCPLQLKVRIHWTSFPSVKSTCFVPYDRFFGKGSVGLFCRLTNRCFAKTVWVVRHIGFFCVCCLLLLNILWPYVHANVLYCTSLCFFRYKNLCVTIKTF